MTVLRQLADELLDNNERFQQFVMISFDDEADANQQLPRERCLKALVAVYELIAAGACHVQGSGCRPPESTDERPLRQCCPLLGDDSSPGVLPLDAVCAATTTP